MARFCFPTPAITRTVVIIAAAAFIAACGKPEPPAMPPMEIAVIKVQPRDIPIYLDMIGQTLGSVDIPIRARVDGVLEEIHFLEGRNVTKDQLLDNVGRQVVLDIDDFAADAEFGQQFQRLVAKVTIGAAVERQ